IDRFLSRHEFPKREIWLRDWIQQKDIRRYKHESLSKLERRQEACFIFVGDDAEYDPEVFSAFRERNPDRTLAIYVRRMRGRPLPDGVIPFHSAFEIALAELAAGRMSVPQVSRVGKAIMDHGDPDHIIPYFAALPSEIEDAETIENLARVVEGVNRRY